MYSLLVGRVLERLHDAGINHLQFGRSHHLRHVLINVDDPTISEDDKKNGKATCYMVDFSSARIHNCKRRVPIIKHDSYLTTEESGCDEVANILFLLGFLPKYTIDSA